jgi:hypothetical protein
MSDLKALVGAESLLYMNDSQAEITSLEARLLEKILDHLAEDPRTLTNVSSPTKNNRGDQLPTCESLMQSPNSPFADGAFLTRAVNTWFPRADGSRELKLPFTCRLKRFTSSQARQCLANRHLSFIGDSLSRYQFLSLVHFIERGDYPARFGMSKSCDHIDENGLPTCSKGPSVCMEGDWSSVGGWKGFHQGLGGDMDGGVFHGRLQCGCAREAGPPQLDELTENALYESDNGVKISYIGEIGFGNLPSPVHGWNFTDCSKNGTCRSATEDNDALFTRAKAHDWDWNAPLHEALNSSLPHVLPDVDIAIYNRGHWGALDQELAEKVMPLLHQWAGKGRCFYRTTTAGPITHRLREPETTYIKMAAFNAGCGFLDFAHLTEEFRSLPFGHPAPPREENERISNFRERGDIFWDSVHFVPWVNEEMNNLLLNVVCNLET